MSIIYKIIDKLEERSFYNESPKLYTSEDIKHLIEIVDLEKKMENIENTTKDLESINNIKREIEKKARIYFKY